MKDISSPEQIRFGFPNADWSSLKRRLRSCRIAPGSANPSWCVGPPHSWMTDLIKYWTYSFDWETQEKKINQFPHYKVKISDLDLHFIWIKSTFENSTPILLLHGWPGSFIEFTKLANILSDPTDPLNSTCPFDLVIPSLPGFGLSVREHNFGYSLPEMADLFHLLMHDVLTYKKYMVQGGDLGSFVGSIMAQSHPSRIIGLHLNFLPIARNESEFSMNPDLAVQNYRGELSSFLKNESAYQLLHSTKPQTIAYALYDSPIGLAAWISEKFATWSDTNYLNSDSSITWDELLTNITYYWLSGTAGSSLWPYYSRAHSVWPISQDNPVHVPMGYSEFPKEILRPPRILAENVYTKIVQWKSADFGGHFAAMEQPTVLAEHIRAFREKIT